MNTNSNTSNWSLEDQKLAFSKRKFLATPLAGMIVWLAIGICGTLLPQKTNEWIIFIGTGSIAYLGMFLSKFTGENFLSKKKRKNSFDALFFYTVAQALLVYSIAIPFYLMEPQSLPLTVGILTGLMWFPFSWMIDHWIGIFHAIARTIGVLILWYVFPDERFIAIPFLIVLLYIITLWVLKRNRRNFLKGS